ncbi:MAG: TetR/AcrR family transcriptional regulator [Polyangiaceae bacterium]|nr:TetR/AcrR family transcriptional regulator [Polyangiaceae bacterium]
MDSAKKECILLEAARAFARFGFKKVSIDEIARGAGVGKGTVYLAAESKEDLYYQVLHREIRSWQAECANVIDPRVSADELLRRLLAAAMEYLDGRPLVRELLLGETSRTLPTWADRFAELASVGRTNVAEVLRIGIKQGVFRRDLDVETVAGLLQDFHLTAQAGSPKRGDELAKRAQVGLDLVLNGLRSRDQTKKV